MIRTRKEKTYVVENAVINAALTLGAWAAAAGRVAWAIISIPYAEMIKATGLDTPQGRQAGRDVLAILGHRANLVYEGFGLAFLFVGGWAAVLFGVVVTACWEAGSWTWSVVASIRLAGVYYPAQAIPLDEAGLALVV